MINDHALSLAIPLMVKLEILLDVWTSSSLSSTILIIKFCYHYYCICLVSIWWREYWQIPVMCHNKAVLYWPAIKISCYQTRCVVQQKISRCLKPFVCVIKQFIVKKNYTKTFIKDQRRSVWLNKSKWNKKLKQRGH